MIDARTVGEFDSERGDVLDGSNPIDRRSRAPSDFIGGSFMDAFYNIPYMLLDGPLVK